MKTADLTGAALNWAVAKCEGYTEFVFWHTGAVTTRYPNGVTVNHNYSTDWAQGGPIIEREKLDLYRYAGYWGAHHPFGNGEEGPTPLIAAMRCFVASKLGDEIDIPEEFQ